ncbi:hypothetical protein KA078_00735 [Candidatus Woesebacteria bacterium]|nr:hypothetical protein [Candidatus Woesebacteria bacterium]
MHPFFKKIAVLFFLLFIVLRIVVDKAIIPPIDFTLYNILYNSSLIAMVITAYVVYKHLFYRDIYSLATIKNSIVLFIFHFINFFIFIRLFSGTLDANFNAVSWYHRVIGAAEKYKLLYYLGVSVLLILPFLHTLLLWLYKHIRFKKCVLQLFYILGVGVTAIVAALLLCAYFNVSILRKLPKNNLTSVTAEIVEKAQITHSMSDFLDCYIQSHPSTLLYIIKLFIGDTYFVSAHDRYFESENCTVIYINRFEETSSTAFSERARLAELLIRTYYSTYIKLNAYKKPSQTVQQIPQAISSDTAVDGLYRPQSDSIEISDNATEGFATLIHEQVHAFSSYDVLYHQGLSEALTDYVTFDILSKVTGKKMVPTYYWQVEALNTLLEYVDKNILLDAYFNTNFNEISTQVDAKTYPGAFCSFNEYLIVSVTDGLGTEKKNLEIAKKYSLLAKESLRDSSLKHEKCIDAENNAEFCN